MGDKPPLLEGKIGDSPGVAYLRLSSFTKANIELAGRFLSHYCFLPTER